MFVSGNEAKNVLTARNINSTQRKAQQIFHVSPYDGPVMSHFHLFLLCRIDKIKDFKILRVVVGCVFRLLSTGAGEGRDVLYLRLCGDTDQSELVIINNRHES